jgi:hypothetical protein
MRAVSRFRMDISGAMHNPARAAILLSKARPTSCAIEAIE